MNASLVSNILNYFLITLVVGLWIVLMIRMVKGRLSPVKSVSATVIDKYKAQSVSRFSGALKPQCYMVVFSAGEKKLSFSVSEFSFQHGYQIGEKGMLKYRGTKIIDFG